MDGKDIRKAVGELVAWVRAWLSPYCQNSLGRSWAEILNDWARSRNGTHDNYVGPGGLPKQMDEEA